MKRHVHVPVVQSFAVSQCFDITEVQVKAKLESSSRLDESVVLADRPHETFKSDSTKNAAGQTKIAENIREFRVDFASEQLQEDL